MKRITKNIVLLLIAMFVLAANPFSTNAEEKINHKIYDVKDKKDVILNLYDFYQETKHTGLIKKNKEEVVEEIEENVESTINTVERNIILTNNVVSYAVQFVGYPYVSGGTSLTSGTDCSGFVQLIYATYGVNLPRTTTEQAQVGQAVSIDNVEPGDIISYGYNGIATHSSIYIGNGQIIHASTPELGIRVDNMNIMPIVTIRRI